MGDRVFLSSHVTSLSEALQTIEALGLPVLILVSVGLVFLFLVLLFGAVSLHLTTRMLKFKQRSFRKAFGTNLLIVFAPTLSSVGAQMIADFSTSGVDPVWPYHVGAVLLVVLGWVFPVLLIQHSYKQTFTRSLVAYTTAGAIEVAIIVGLFFAHVAGVVALSAILNRSGT